MRQEVQTYQYPKYMTGRRIHLTEFQKQKASNILIECRKYFRNLNEICDCLGITIGLASRIFTGKDALPAQYVRKVVKVLNERIPSLEIKDSDLRPDIFY